MNRNILAIGITFLLLSVAVTPIIGISNNDDTTPPVTTISFNPPIPNGENGWYVSDVTVRLNATDDLSGVNVTYYRIDGGKWVIYESPFIISEDGDDILIEFYSVDKAGNVEEVKSQRLDIDQTEPYMEIFWEYIGGDPLSGWELLIEAWATDDMSGMNRVEFRLDNAYETVYGPGPLFEWITKVRIFYPVLGLIRNLNITEDFVKFFGIIFRIGNANPSLSFFDVYAYDNAGNRNHYETHGHIYPPYDPGIYLFKSFSLENYYKGFISKHFIFAIFYM